MVDQFHRDRSYRLRYDILGKKINFSRIHSNKSEIDIDRSQEDKSE